MAASSRCAPDFDKKSDQSEHPAALRIPKGVCFFSLDGRQGVFSEPAQRLYALNDTAAYIWCRIEEHWTAQTIIADLIESGVDARLATQHVQQAIHNWLRLGALTLDYHLEQSPPNPWHSFAVDMGRLRFAVHAASEPLAQRLLPLFADGVTTGQDRSDVFHIVEISKLIHVFHNRLNVISCAAAELAPSFKAYITEQILRQSETDVVFHAACLVRSGKSILISGAPGAGKTTLALHLMKAGFEYRSDDIVLIAANGGVRGISFAPTVKSGAWEPIGELYPELNDLPVHRRPDGKRVRYFPPPRVARDLSYPVSQIVFLRHDSTPAADLQRLSCIDALSRVVEGSFSPRARLTQATFNALKQLLTTAASFDLQYKSAQQARNSILSQFDA